MKNEFKFSLISIILAILICGLGFYKLMYQPKKIENFKVKIIDIDINEDSIIVEGLEENDPKYQGEFKFKISDKIDINYRGEKVNLRDSIILFYTKPTVEITFYGKVKETNPAVIENVLKINVIEEKSNQLVIYLEGDITKKDKENIEQKINSLDNIVSITFKSKEEWKLEMKEYSNVFADTLDNLDSNPLLDTYTIIIDNPDKIEEIAKILENIDKVSSVQY